MGKMLSIFLMVFATNVSFANKDSGVQIVGFLGGSLLNESRTPTVLTNGSQVTLGEIVSTYENSVTGGLEIRSLDSDAWLLKGGVRTMPYRKATMAKLEAPSLGSQNLLIVTPFSYRLTSVYYDVGYCWETFYMFIGLSYNFFDFSAPGSTVPFRTKNGMGSTFGIGFKLSENWAIEYAGHVAKVAIESGPQFLTTDEYTINDAFLTLRIGF